MGLCVCVKSNLTLSLSISLAFPIQQTSEPYTVKQAWNVQRALTHTHTRFYTNIGLPSHSDPHTVRCFVSRLSSPPLFYTHNSLAYGRIRSRVYVWWTRNIRSLSLAHNHHSCAPANGAPTNYTHTHAHSHKHTTSQLSRPQNASRFTYEGGENGRAKSYEQLRINGFPMRIGERAVFWVEIRIRGRVVFLRSLLYVVYFSMLSKELNAMRCCSLQHKLKLSWTERRMMWWKGNGWWRPTTIKRGLTLWYFPLLFGLNTLYFTVFLKVAYINF